MQHENIRRVSIDKFYEIITGNPTAFLELCQILPKVIQDVIDNEKQQIIENTVIQDLKEQEIDNILQNLYLVAFKKYQGFDNFSLNI